MCFALCEKSLSREYKRVGKQCESRSRREWQQKRVQAEADANCDFASFVIGQKGVCVAVVACDVVQKKGRVAAAAA